MKNLLILLFVFLTIKGSSQCEFEDPTDLSLKPSGTVESSIATSRIERYKMIKNKNKYATNAILYEPCGFLDLLKKLTDPNKYSGLRIYFAADTKDSNRLMLVFVPTINTTVGQYNIELDDTSSCFRIVGKAAKPIPAKEASGYIKWCQDHQLKNFTDDGVKHYKEMEITDRTFVETNSLWYDIALFRRGINTNTNTIGFRTYLQNMINLDSVDNVVVNLGGFGLTYSGKYYYQLTLIFSFVKNGIMKASFLGSAPKIEKVLEEIDFAKGEKLVNKKQQLLNKEIDKFKKLIGDYGSIDTGVPCPPPPAGSQTCEKSGAILP